MRPSALFDTVVIAGVGLIGGSVGLGIHQRFLAERVIGLDHDPAALDAARGLGAIDEAQLAPGPWLEEAGLVILATPVRTLVPLGRQLRPYLNDAAIVTDVGSVKNEIVEGLRELTFVGGHPMTGSERIGVQNADAALLENAVWVLTPDRESDPGAVATVRDFVEHLGARPLQVDPAQHDRLVAAVSHIPYLTAVALTTLVSDDEDRDLMMLLAAGGFRDLTRVASGSPVMSRDMVVGNLEAVRETLSAFPRPARHPGRPDRGSRGAAGSGRARQAQPRQLPHRGPQPAAGPFRGGHRGTRPAGPTGPHHQSAGRGRGQHQGYRGTRHP